MAFFKFRKAAADKPAAPAQTESVETLRRRARHRLIGAAVLVLVGVLGFPLLFDTQPRPVAVDIPIEIPDRNKAKPLPLPVSSAPNPDPAASHPAAETAAAGRSPVAAPARPAASGTVTSAVAEARPEPKPEAKAEPKPESKPPAPLAGKPAEASKHVAAASKPQPPVAAKPAADADAARARALLDGKPVQVADKPAADKPAGDKAAAADGRYVVQVGAFSDAAKAREIRLKVERTGLKTYTHVADTKDGKRTRVRVGPFATRAEADKAAGKIKALDLPAAILTL